MHLYVIYIGCHFSEAHINLDTLAENQIQAICMNTLPFHYRSRLVPQGSIHLSCTYPNVLKYWDTKK